MFFDVFEQFLSKLGIFLTSQVRNLKKGAATHLRRVQEPLKPRRGAVLQVFPGYQIQHL